MFVMRRRVGNTGLPPATDSALAVGDAARRPLGRAVFGSLALAAVFVLAFLPAPSLPTMWSNGPWAQDPYHVVVSFGVMLVPLAAVLCLSRVPLCRRDEPLPTRRARDLLRVSRVLVALVSVTVASTWISVAWPAQRYSWTGPTVAAFAELAVLTVALPWAGALLRQGFKAPVRAGLHPDWLADVIAVGERASGRLGSRRPRALAVLDWTDANVITGIRRRPLSAAAVLAAAFGVAVALSQGVQEGYPPGGYLLFFLVAASGVFAFLVIAGSHLGLVVNDEPRPAAGARAALRECLVHAAVAASASVPVAVAFRSVAWSAFGITEQQAGWRDLNELVLAAAAVTAVITVAAESLARSRQPGRRGS